MLAHLFYFRRLTILAGFLVTAALIVAAEALGGNSCPSCGNGSSPLPVTQVAPSYHWESFSDGDPSQVKLMRGNTQVGVWVHGERIYYPITGYRTFGPPCAPPISPPAARDCACGVGKCCPPDKCTCLDGPCCKKEVCPCTVATQNFGVSQDKLKGRPPRYSVNGVEVGRSDVVRILEATAAPGGGKLTDDSGLLRLTLVADDQVTGPILRDLASSPKLAAWKDRLLVQAYRPSDWPVREYALDHLISLRTPEGKELLALDAYRGPDALADAIETAINPPKPTPVPAPEPSQPVTPVEPASPPLVTNPWWKSVPWSLWGVLGAALAFLIFDRAFPVLREKIHA